MQEPMCRWQAHSPHPIRSTGVSKHGLGVGAIRVSDGQIRMEASLSAVTRHKQNCRALRILGHVLKQIPVNTQRGRGAVARGGHRGTQRALHHGLPQAARES